jgi:hypothetical protein
MVSFRLRNWTLPPSLIAPLILNNNKMAIERAEGGQPAVQYCDLGAFQAGQPKDGFGDTAFSSGTWLLRQDLWPPCH